MIGVERYERAAEIGDVFTHGQIAFHMEARKRLVAVELPAEHRSARSELIGIRVRPPGREYAAAVVFASLVVVSVDHFVTDHGADAAVVDRWIGRRIEEGRLEYPGGKDHLVEAGIVA